MALEQIMRTQSEVSITQTQQQLLKNIDLELLGERIRQARTAQKISQRDLCKELFTSAYLSYVELGKTRPTLSNLEKLAERLHKPADYFLRPSGLNSSSKDPDSLEREQIRNLEVQNQLTQGQVALTGSDFSQVEAILTAVRPFLTRLPQLDQAHFLMLEGSFYNAMAVGSQAATALEKAQALVDGLNDKSPETPGLLLPQLELEKGVALIHQEQPLKALEHFNKAVTNIRGQANGPDRDRLNRQILIETSRTYLAIGDPAKALEFARQLLELPEENMSNKAASLFKEGLRLAGLGDYQQSAYYLGRSAQVWQDRQELVALQEVTLDNAQIYLKTKKYPEALKAARLAYRLHTGYPEDKYARPGELKALLMLVQIGLGMDDLSAVKTYIDQARQLFETLGDPEPLEEARFYHVAGKAYYRLGSLDIAGETYQKAVDILEPVVARDPESSNRGVLADIYYDYSQLLKRRDSSAKALEYLDKAFRLRSR